MDACSRLHPVDKLCPVCGAEDWGLCLDGGPMMGKPFAYWARCYPNGHDRPVEERLAQ